MNKIVHFLVLLSCFSVSTFAQTDNQRQVGLDSIVITTTRLPEVNNQTAGSVVIIDQKQLESLTQINSDMSVILGLAVPSIGLSSNTTSNRSQGIRGRQILVLIDGIPQSTPLRNTDRDLRTISPFAIERIEVIEGASALYGSGASGGIVNFITKNSHTKSAISGKTTLGISDANPFKNKHTNGYTFNQQFYGNYQKLSYVVNGGLVKTGRAVDGEGEYISPRYGLSDILTQNLFTKIGYDFTDKSNLRVMYNYYSSLQDTDLIATGGEYLKSPQIGVIGEKNPNAINEGTKYNHNGYLRYHYKDIFANTNLEASLFGQSLYTVFDYRENSSKSPRWQETGGQATIKSEKIGARINFLTNTFISSALRNSAIFGLDYLYDKTSQPLVDGRLWVPELKANNIGVYLQNKSTLFDYIAIKWGQDMIILMSVFRIIK